MGALSGKIAVVAGATRGAGRGIARMLGEAGATVYCSGRSVRGALASGPERPETIDETAEMVSAAGGVGIAVRTDHSKPEEVEALFARVKGEAGRLDILVNDIWGGEALMEWRPFWKLDTAKGFQMLDGAIRTHIITAKYAAPLMLEQKSGLIVEITDGDHHGYRGALFYDLAKMGVIRLGFAMAEDLGRYGVTALTVTPGFLRSEEMLERFEVTEANWRDGAKHDADFAQSETPCFVGRAVAALAADANVAAKAGQVFASWTLAREYGFTDIDGGKPDWGEHVRRRLTALIAKGALENDTDRYVAGAWYGAYKDSPDYADLMRDVAALLKK